MRRVALVTGGARGIGLGIARALAADGFDLVAAGMRPESAAAGALAELHELGAETLYVQADVSDAAARARLLAAARERFGRLHVLVNNAGVAPRERLDVLEATETSYEHVMRTNLQGPYFLTQATARWMIEQKTADPGHRGCVVFITSVSAAAASVNRGDYCLSKAGLSMAAQLFAVRLAEFGLPVYEVRPGITATDMTAGVREKYDRLIAAGLLLQPRWGTPEDVGRTVAMLARGDLPYSTGQVLNVDGGMLVHRL